MASFFFKLILLFLDIQLLCVSAVILSRSQDDNFINRVISRSNFTESQSYGPKANPDPEIGIIGAGISGLYSALLLESLGLEYRIFEASARAGGRLWTHYFDEDVWQDSKPGEPAYYDYFDVGAMRIPRTDFMSRVVGNKSSSLINFINANVQTKDRLKLIPFVYKNNNTFLLYNNILQNSQVSFAKDPFQVGLSSLDPVAKWDSELKVFTDALTADFQTGFGMLADYDSFSVRDYLLHKDYTDDEIDFLETIAEGGTGHLDKGLPEAILESWVFEESPLDSWVTVEGGFSSLVKAMLEIVSQPVEYMQQVTKIAYASGGNQLTVETNDTVHQFDHVINTTPLGVLQHTDLDSLNLDYEKLLAIRKINYDPAIKIGLKFKSRWWEKLARPIKGGASFTDLSIRQTHYPSYGIGMNASGVLIASYAWGQDAARLSTLTSLEDKEELTNSTIHDLARLHNLTADFLREQYVDAFAYSWANNPLTMGGFVLFGPGEFFRLLPKLMEPAANNRLHFAGEGTSVGHAWVVGALNSAYRCVTEILVAEDRRDLLEKLVDQWGVVNDFDMGWFDIANKTGTASETS